MRRLLFATLALFATLGAASAQERWLESSVTLTLRLSSTGEEQTKPGKNDTSTVSAPLQRSRFGNADVLAALVDADLISEVKGWRLVALWADWPDEDPVSGYAYRFYARRGSGVTLETVPVPSSILAIEPKVGAFSIRHTVSDDTIAGGSEKQEVFSRLAFETPNATGDLGGVLVGTRRYVSVYDGEETRYVPGANRATLQGIHYLPAADRFGVAKGSISFGAAKFVAADYLTPEGTTGAVRGEIGNDNGPGSPGPTIPTVDTSISVSVN